MWDIAELSCLKVFSVVDCYKWESAASEWLEKVQSFMQTSVSLPSVFCRSGTNTLQLIVPCHCVHRARCQDQDTKLCPAWSQEEARMKWLWTERCEEEKQRRCCLPRGRREWTVGVVRGLSWQAWSATKKPLHQRTRFTAGTLIKFSTFHHHSIIVRIQTTGGLS